MSAILHTQKQEILDHMLNIGPISPIEALREYGCFRLAARISDLRNDHVEIETTMKSLINRKGRHIRFAVYSCLCPF